MVRLFSVQTQAAVERVKMLLGGKPDMVITDCSSFYVPGAESVYNLQKLYGYSLTHMVCDMLLFSS